jgi:hypothetical protein
MPTLHYKGLSLSQNESGDIVAQWAPGAIAGAKEEAVLRWYMGRIISGADPAELPQLQGLVIEHSPAPHS